MADIKQLETAINAIQSGLSLADRLAGTLGRLRTPERQAHYARWRALRLELRAARALAQGKGDRAQSQEAKSKVWADEASRLEAQTCRATPF